MGALESQRVTYRGETTMKDRRSAAETYTDMAATLRRQNAHIDKQRRRIEALERALHYARTELAALVPNPERVSVADWPVKNPADAVCLNLAFAEMTAALSGTPAPPLEELMLRRPKGSNADEWAMFLEHWGDAHSYIAVQIAEAIDAAAGTPAPARSGGTHIPRPVRNRYARTEAGRAALQEDK